MGCLLLSAALAVASLFIGTSDIAQSWQWLRHGDAASQLVLWDIRLPRTLGAWCTGALLALAGTIAQGLFRNPLADPYLLGSASGAALGVAGVLIATQSAVSALAWVGLLGLTGAAFVGACGAIALTLALARGALQTSNLLLAGVIVAFVLGAVTSLALLASPEAWRAMQVFLLGSTGFLGWSSTAVLALALAGCTLPALALARGLDALTLGEDTAVSLGLSLRHLRLAYLGLLSLATGAAVAQVGVVSFVGLVAPHLVRQTAAMDHRRLLWCALLCGGVLLQAADLLSRWLVRPAELPVGAITACLGGAYLLVLIWHRSHHE
ncbi:MAG: iron ABC transporter permease [Burkholderiales bacterium]|nr:iron ABC transporter permease [Burkholderiales bacterium]MDE1927804.1 iron ABC transporter permease [Burkholderiales bacterium]MDE2158672.1 iron ABC transporter permease [Burkholderiales bacterium]MDE2501511.1 iron ABC transporter permease [Burkholderiales bacterium]